MVVHRDGGTLKTRIASCSCGRLTVTVTAEPLRISICHCLACQRRTGSVFGMQARFPADDAQVSGDSTAYVRTSDDGNRVSFHFCPACGSTVFYLIEDLPGSIAIPVGAFADPDFPAPRVSVYEARKHAWVGVPEDIEHFP